MDWSPGYREFAPPAALRPAVYCLWVSVVPAGGAPPRLVLRFRRFVSSVDHTGEAADLAWLAAKTGYADQAHLTRESTRLAGLPPAALARVRHHGLVAPGRDHTPTPLQPSSE